MKRPRWPNEPKRYTWIVDGHNAIFAHPLLESLQTGEQKAEARRRLEEMLERLAAEHGLTIHVVYDGSPGDHNPDARRRGRVLTYYSLPPHEEADDRILLMVGGWIRERRKVAVVTSDRATLGARLPSGVLQLAPLDLFRRLRTGPSPAERKLPSGDFSDIEAHFLRMEKEDRPRGDPGTGMPAAPSGPLKPPIAPKAVGQTVAPARPSAPEQRKKPARSEEDRERRRKRGLRRQERRRTMQAAVKKPRRRPR